MIPDQLAEQIRARGLVGAPQFSKKLLVLPDDDAILFRDVTRFIEDGRLTNALSMFRKLRRYGVAVVEHEVITIDDDPRAYLASERLDGIGLVEALVENPDALPPTLRFIRTLGAYYMNTLGVGGFLPQDFYESQFFFGRSRESGIERVFVVDLDPYVIRFDPADPSSDSHAIIISQVGALVGLFLMAEDLSTRGPELRSFLSDLFGRIGEIFPSSREGVDAVQKTLPEGGSAQIRFALEALKAEESVVAKGREGLLPSMVLSLPGHTGGERNRTYIALLEEMDSSGAILNHVSLSEGWAQTKPVLGDPLVVALSRKPAAVEAVEAFCRGVGIMLMRVRREGGPYPVNLWTHRLLFGRLSHAGPARIMLGDPLPLCAELAPDEPKSVRRFTAFFAELGRLILDAEELSGRRLAEARKEWEENLRLVCANSDELQHKMTVALDLFRSGKRTPLEYWMS